MARFVSRPGVVIEAHQYDGTPLPMELAGAVLRRRPDGGIDIAAADGPRHCKMTDWVIRDRDGAYSVMRDAAFEVMFEPRIKRPYNRRVEANV